MPSNFNANLKIVIETFGFGHEATFLSKSTRNPSKSCRIDFNNQNYLGFIALSKF